MFDAVPGVGPWVGLLRLLVGDQHHVDGHVAVGVDADLETGPVHRHHLFFYLVLLHGQDAVVALGALVGLGQVSGPGGDGAVGHHLDSADAEPVVPQAGLDAGVPKGGKLGVPHQGVYPETQLAGRLPVLIGLKFLRRHPGVVDAGQANPVQHAADGPQPFAAHIFVLWRNEAKAHRVDGALEDHAVQPARVRVPAQPSSRRVGGLVVEPGRLQARGVHVVDVSRPVGHQDGVGGAHRVQVIPVEVASIVRWGPVSLGVVELEALHPSAGRRFLDPLAQGGLDLGDGGQVAVGGHHVADAAVQHVDVGVDEPRQHRLAAQVQYLGARPHQAFYVLVAAHPGESSVDHGQRLCPGSLRIHGQNVGVLDYGLGLAVGGGHGGFSQMYF